MFLPACFAFSFEFVHNLILYFHCFPLSLPPSSCLSLPFLSCLLSPPAKLYCPTGKICFADSNNHTIKTRQHHMIFFIRVVYLWSGMLSVLSVSHSLALGSRSISLPVKSTLISSLKSKLTHFRTNTFMPVFICVWSMLELACVCDSLLPQQSGHSSS